jgi:O-antigen/teichoic acid export membrane protein
MESKIPVEHREYIKTGISVAVDKVYRRIFQEEMSPDVQVFLKNLLFVGIGTAVSALTSIVFTVLGGRLLGPEEYGRFALVQSVAMFLYIPMLLGFHITATKFSSEKQDRRRQSDVLTAVSLLVLALVILCLLVYLLFSSYISRLFGISPDLYYFAIAFAGLFTFYSLTTSALRGLNRIRLYSIFQIVYSVCLLSFFGSFIFIQGLSFKAMVLPMLISFTVITLAIFILVLRKFTFGRVKVSIIKILSKYSLFVVVGCFSFEVYSNIDRIIISRFSSVADVGIYTAYYAASMNVAFLLWGIFNMVFFPTVTKYKNKGPILGKINKSIPYLIGLGIPLILLSQFVLLKLYGNQYETNLLWMVLFALTSVCLVIQGIYAWLLNAVGASGARIASLTALSVAVLNIVLNVLLVPRFGISGAAVSLLATYTASIIMVLKLGKPLILKGAEKTGA